MLNLRITTRRTQEDYVAVQKDTGILPISGRHFVGIVSVCVISLVCALPFGNIVELSFESSPLIAMLNRGESTTNTEQNYIQGDDEVTAANLELSADAGSRENYDDAELPSSLFSTQALDDAIASDDGEDKAEIEDVAIPAAPTIRERFTSKDENTKVTAGTSEPATVTEEQKRTETASTPLPGTVSGPLASHRSEKLPDRTHDVLSLLDGEELPSLSALAEYDGRGKAAPAVDSDHTQEVMGLLAGDSLPQVSGLQSYEGVEQPERPVGNWYKQTVHKGDNLSTIFNYLNLPNGTLKYVQRAAGKNDLALKVGTQIHFLIDNKNNVLELVKPINDDEQVRFTRLKPNTAFTAVHEPTNAHVESQKEIAQFADAEKMPNAVEAAKDRAKAQAEAKIQAEKDAIIARDNAKNRPRLVIAEMRKGESFNSAAKRSGLTASEISTISQALSGKLNLKRLTSGDTFRVLFSGIGTKSQLTAVEFNSARSGKITMYRHPDSGNLYEENGYKPTAGVFRRFPVNGNLQVSSPFNPRRFNPVRKRIAPHNGVDFRMPIGTPVYSPSDGVVTYAGYMRGGGYTIIIKHMGAYSTVYMHLSRLNVRKGQSVHLGQLIAKSGNTGGSTGPHLHYEIRINDRSVDPLKVDLPAGNKNLANQRREKFQSTVKNLKADLYKDSLALRK